MKKSLNLLLIALLLLLAPAVGAQEAATRAGTIVGPGGPDDPTTGWTIQVTCGAGGTISPAGTDGKIIVKPGDDQPFTITAADGFRIASVKVDGAEQLTAADGALTTYSYTFSNVKDNTHSISIAFITNRFTLTATAGKGGTIRPATVQINQGGNQLFAITPDEGYEIADVKVDGTSAGAISTYLYPNVQKDGTVEASFKGREHTVTVTSAQYGTLSVSPLTAGKAAYGTELTLEATPDAGYVVDRITANGLRLTGNSYRLTGDVTFAATFKKAVLTVTVDGSSTGGNLTVRKGATALLTGTHTVEYGVELVLENKSASGYSFTKYEVNPSSLLSEEKKITVTENVSVRAVFTSLTYKVTVTAPEAAEGLLTINGETAKTGDKEYPYQAELILGNQPATGKDFEAYVMNPTSALSGNKVKVTGDISLSIRFKTSSASGEGTDPEDGKKLYAVTFSSPLMVKNDGTTIASGAKVKEGTLLSLLVPNTNTQRLVSLTAGGNPIDFLSSGGVNTAIYEVKAPVTLAAGFVKNTYPVSVASPEGGTLQALAGGSPVVAGGEYVYGTVISVVATPVDGYTLTRIMAGRQDITLSKRVTLTEDLLLSAVFTPKGAIGPDPDPSNPDPNAPAGIDLTPQSVVYNGKTQAFAVLTAPGGVVDKVSVAYKQNGRNATPLKAGLYDVVLTRPADDRFAALDQTLPGGLEIRKAAATIAALDYEEEQLVGSMARTTAVLKTGKAESLGKEVKGTFAWTNPSAVENRLTVTASGYQEVRFTPDDKDNYRTATGQVYIQVGKEDPLAVHQVTLKTEGKGSVALYNGDLACLPAGPFYDGMSLTLKATAAEGYRFQGFRIEGVLYSYPSYTLSVTKDQTIIASFVPKEDPANPSDPSSPTALQVKLTLPSPSVYDGKAKLVGVTSTPALSGWQVEYRNKENQAVIPVEAGTYRVMVSRAEDETYLAYEQSSSLTITKATPRITTWPEAGLIPIGALLEDAVLSGGAAMADGLGVVSGVFLWNEPRKVMQAGGRESFRFSPADPTNFFSVSGETEVQVLDAQPPVQVTYSQASGGTLSVVRADDSTPLPSGSLIPFGTEISIRVTAASSYKLKSLFIGAADYTVDALNGDGLVIRPMYTSQPISVAFVRTSTPNPGPDPDPDPSPNPDPTPDPDPNPGPDPGPGPDPDPTPGTGDYTVWVRTTGLGTVSPETSRVRQGDKLVFQVTPGHSQQLVDVRLNGNSVGAVTEYQVQNIRGDSTVEVVFSQPGIPVYTLTSKVTGRGGYVTPRIVRVAKGSNHQFVMHVEKKGVLEDVQIGTKEGMKSIGTPSSYIFRGVGMDSLLVATFAIPTAVETIEAGKNGRIDAVGSCLYVIPSAPLAVLRVYTMTGQLVLQRTLFGETHLCELSKGLYIAELSSGPYPLRVKVYIE